MGNKSKNKNRKLKVVIFAEIAAIGLICSMFVLIWFKILPLPKSNSANFLTSGSPVAFAVTSDSAMHTVAPDQQSTDDVDLLNIESSQVPISNIAVEEFHTSNMNETLPADILEEIAYYSGGGPSDDFQCNTPQIAIDPKDAELMSLNVFTICGLSNGQSLLGQIRYPDGRTITQDVQILTSPNGTIYAELGFMPNINDPAGVYDFSLEGIDGKFESNAYYHLPIGTRLYDLGNNQVFLYGFMPNENVRLFAYYLDNEVWKFSGWEEYLVDQNGQLVVSLAFDDIEGTTRSYTFVAVGSISGEAQLLFNRPSGGRFSWVSGKYMVNSPNNSKFYMQCTGEQSLNSHLIEGYHAEVLSSVTLFVNPRLDARALASVSEKSKIYLSSGPYCENNQIWWRADTYEGTGYLLEKDDTYYVGPLRLADEFCNGLQSSFTIGEWVMVDLPEAANINVYEAPSYAAGIIYTFTEKGGVSIEEGPVCADGTIWWKTYDFTHEAGWIAEYQNGIHIFGPFQ